MAQMKLEFKGFDEIMKKLNKLEADTRTIVDEALEKTHEIVTAKAESAIASSNLPAGGRFSTGATLNSLQRDVKVTWKGTEASVKVGFNIKKGGLASIFLMYGTPRMAKVQAIYDAFYSAQTEGEVINAQKEIFYKALGELGE